MTVEPVQLNIHDNVHANIHTHTKKNITYMYKTHNYQETVNNCILCTCGNTWPNFLENGQRVLDSESYT